MTEETLGAAERETAGVRRFETSFFEVLRRQELQLALEVLARHGCAPGGAILEIGGGTGWQARDLAAAGYRVRSVDVEASARRVFPVETYDGHRLPLPDAACDAVFSSNVLEHIAHIYAFQSEIARVLKPGGIAVHLMPTPSWRLWTFLAHYPWLVRAALSAMGLARPGGDADIVTHAAARRTVPELLRRIALSPRHGETGTALGELWSFSGPRWRRLFRRSGWRVVEHRSNGVFYTGYLLLGPRLALVRAVDWRAFSGGSCRIYVLRAG